MRLLPRRSNTFTKLAGIIALASAAGWGLTSVAGNTQFAWNPNPEPDIAGYRLWYGTAPRNYTSVVNAGAATSATLSNLNPGTTYYLAVTAYDRDGFESGYSTELPFMLPSATPTPTATPSPTPPAPTPTPSPTPTPQVSPTPSPSFTIVVNPNPIPAPTANGYVAFTVTITPLNGFSAPLIISTDGLPSFVARGTIMNPPGSLTVTMRMFVFSCLPSGNYPFTVTAQACGPVISRSANLTIMKP